MIGFLLQVSLTGSSTEEEEDSPRSSGDCTVSPESCDKGNGGISVIDGLGACLVLFTFASNWAPCILCSSSNVDEKIESWSML